MSEKVIHYLAEGLLGDFIMQLSIVCENFHKTGKKGVVHMIGTNFRSGLEKTYEEIHSIITSQYYIENLTMELPENFDNAIYISSWRNSHLLFQVNFFELFLHEYQIEMGNHAWITTNVDDAWSSKILIHITKYRFPVDLNFSDIVSQYGEDNIVFLDLEIGDYDFFVNRTGVSLPHIYKPASFVELCTMIQSCALFIGSASMPSCVARAMRKKKIIGMPPDKNDFILLDGLI